MNKWRDTRVERRNVTTIRVVGKGLARARAAATRIEQDGNRAADVINRLRSFYKKGTPPEREMMEVKDIIREIMVLLRAEAIRYSIMIHSELDANMPNIVPDRVQLQQVFMNLMLNAIEGDPGCPDGSPTVPAHWLYYLPC